MKENQVLTFIDSIPVDDKTGLRDRLICQLLYATGIRVSELIQINCAHLHLDERELLVLGKGNKERFVVFGDFTVSMLRQYMDRDRPKLESKGTDALFLNHLGTRLTARSVQRMIKKHAHEQGVPQSITPHVLRHSFATSLINNGADLKTIQELLGHENVSTTQVYTHVSTQKLEETFKKAHPRA